MVAKLEEVKITQESVDEFFNNIDTEALTESMKLSIGACEYCTPNHETKPLDSWEATEDENSPQYGGYAGINRSDNTLWYHITDGQDLVASRFKIAFCPKCGRRLLDNHE